jgi:hypothetical protein
MGKSASILLLAIAVGTVLAIVLTGGTSGTFAGLQRGPARQLPAELVSKFEAGD